MTYNLGGKPKHVIIQFPPAEWHPNDTAEGSTLKMRHTLAAGETCNTSTSLHLCSPPTAIPPLTQASAKEKRCVFSTVAH